MKTKLLILLFVTSSVTALKAQWDSITRFNQVINDLAVYNGNLFIAGGFTQNQSSTCYWSAYYDGSNITRQTTLIGGSGIRQMAVFGTDLYAVDALDHGLGTGVGVWDGSTWQDGGSTNISHSVIYADGNDLYVGDDNDKVRKKTGTGAFTLFHDFGAEGSIGHIMRYNNKLVFSGAFNSVNGVPAHNVAQWDGTNWQALGAGTSTGVYCMEVYNNELYLAGLMDSAGGSPVDHIAKWNGSSWSSVGGGITGSTFYGVVDMKATPAGLLVTGDFTQAGSVTTKDVARWNGSQWFAMPLYHGDARTSSIEYYNNKVYVGTYDFNHAHLFRYNGVIGIAENNGSDKNLVVYPNPAKDNITISFVQGADKGTVSLFNIEGSKLLEKRIEGNKNAMDISMLNSGIYFVEVQTEKATYLKKIIKN